MPADSTRPCPVILVIDDSPDFRNMLGSALTIEGYEVVEVADGKEGLLRLHERQPDLVLLDVVMPEKDGILTLREILRRQPEARVITLSGRPAASDYNEAAVQLGARRGFEKPFPIAVLRDAVRSSLSAATAIA